MAGETVLGDQPAVEAVGDLRRPAHKRQLPVVLHRPQLLDEPAGGDQLGAGRQKLRQPLVHPDGHVRIVEADSRAVVAAFGDDLCDLLEQVLLSPYQFEVLNLGLRPPDIAEVGDEDACVTADHADAARAREAGQVPHIHQVRDKEQIELSLGDKGSGVVGAAHAASGGGTPSSFAITSSASR